MRRANAFHPISNAMKCALTTSRLLAQALPDTPLYYLAIRYYRHSPVSSYKYM